MSQALSCSIPSGLADGVIKTQGVATLNPVLRCVIPSGSDFLSRRVCAAAGSYYHGSCAEGIPHKDRLIPSLYGLCRWHKGIGAAGSGIYCSSEGFAGWGGVWIVKNAVY